MHNSRPEPSWKDVHTAMKDEACKELWLGGEDQSGQVELFGQAPH